jgi:hypothetical protein
MRTLLAGHLNWDAVYEAGLRHAVLPLLYRGILVANQDLLPEGAGKIRDTYLANARRNLRLAKTALQVSELFQQQGIQSLLIKGPATAVLAYGDLSLRSFVDLDFLIHPQDFYLAHQMLLSQGWQPSLSLNEKEIKWLLWGDKDLSYHRQSVNLELHWNIAEKGWRIQFGKVICGRIFNAFRCWIVRSIPFPPKISFFIWLYMALSINGVH